MDNGTRESGAVGLCNVYLTSAVVCTDRRFISLVNCNKINVR